MKIWKYWATKTMKMWKSIIKSLTKIGRNFERWAVQTRVNRVDLVKSFPTSIYSLLAKFGVDAAENEPFKVCQKLAKS